MLIFIRFIFLRLTLLIGAVGGLPPSSPGKDGGALRLENEIPLPGVEGRIDHFSADDAGQRLFIAALGNGSVEVVDILKGERIAEIKGLKEPQGLYYDSKTDRLYVTDDVFYDTVKRQIYVIGGEGAVEVFQQRDLDHYENVGRTTTAAGARTGFFVRNSSRLYVAVPHRGSQSAKVLVYATDGS
jgi:DNA-binding beta-propeller fold protein YncE